MPDASEAIEVPDELVRDAGQGAAISRVAAAREYVEWVADRWRTRQAEPGELTGDALVSALQVLWSEDRATYREMLVERIPSHARAALAAAVEPRGARAEPSGEAMPLPMFSMTAAFAPAAPVRALVKGVIDAGDLAVIFGESGGLKSFVVLDLALHVASGLDWAGRKVRRGGVLVIAGEGHAGLRKRVRGWCLAHDLSEDAELPPIVFTEAAADLLGNPEAVALTVERAEAQLGERVELVVVDTLSANFGAGDEGLARDLMIVLGNIRAALRERAVLLVHHVGHTDKTRERGSYALRGAADRRFLVRKDRDAELVVLECLKAKDEAEIDPLVFSWRPIGLGWTDEDGDELTTLVVEFTGQAPPAPKRTLGKVQQAIVSILREQPMVRSDVVNRLQELGVCGRSAGYDAIRALLETGEIVEAFHKIAVPQEPSANV